LKTREDVERLAAAGYKAFLIGERFMTDPDPVRAIAGLGVRVNADTASRGVRL
jgi:indole-3-glycerol phosphate synthase